MGLPSGVSTATVTFGTDADVLGVGATTTLTITPSHTLIWAATGEIIRAFSVSVDAAAGVVGSFEIPHTDQVGFTDELGRAITNWYYTVAGLVARSGETQPYRKVFQVASGVTSLNLDLIPINGTVSAVGIASQLPVTMVNGQVGPVVLDAAGVGAVPNTSDGRTALFQSAEGIATIAEAVAAGTKPGADVAAVGDSQTAGAGSTGGNTYPALLQTLITGNYATPGVVRNYGVGGETSATITGRVSLGAPWLATVVGGIIPPSGGVTVTLVANDGAAVDPLLQGSAGINPVRIAGVEGALSQAGGVYTFTRTTAGTAVVAPRRLAVSTQAARDRKNDTHLIMMGQNDGTTDPTALIGRVRAMVQETSAPSKRFIVMALLTGSSATRDAMDLALVQAFGRRVFNPRTYLARTEAVLEAGLLPTIADETAIRAGTVPPVFMSDAYHPNNLGYARIARGVFERMVELGFDDRWGTKADYTYAPLSNVLVFDDFEGADGTSILSAKPKIGATNWISNGTGTATRQGGALEALTSSGEVQVMTSIGASNYRIQAAVKTRGALQRPKLVFRFLNQSNYMWIDGPASAGGVYRLRSKIADAQSSVDLGVVVTDGDVFDITCNGNALTIKINGTAVHSSTLPFTGTNFAFMAYNGTTGNEAKWENVLVTNP